MALDSAATQGSFWYGIGESLLSLLGSLYSTIQAIFWVISFFRYFNASLVVFRILIANISLVHVGRIRPRRLPLSLRPA